MVIETRENIDCEFTFNESVEIVKGYYANNSGKITEIEKVGKGDDDFKISIKIKVNDKEMIIKCRPDQIKKSTGLKHLLGF